MSTLKPGKTWDRKRAKKKRFITSGPPRDIVGERDMLSIDNPYQRDSIRDLERRDREKSFGVNKEEIEEELSIPPEMVIPNNQPLLWYASMGMDKARLHKFGQAFHYFLIAARKAKTNREKDRYQQSAESNLKAWRAAT